jgi:hypothetical protein
MKRQSFGRLDKHWVVPDGQRLRRGPKISLLEIELKDRERRAVGRLLAERKATMSFFESSSDHLRYLPCLAVEPLRDNLPIAVRANTKVRRIQRRKAHLAARHAIVEHGPTNEARTVLFGERHGSNAIAFPASYFWINALIVRFFYSEVVSLFKICAGVLCIGRS